MNKAKKIHEAIVLHNGWEMDNALWVIENADGSRELRTTSHGSEYTASIAELDEKIAETQASLYGLKKARDLIQGD